MKKFCCTDHSTDQVDLPPISTHLDPKHYDELANGSGISPEIITLNFESVSEASYDPYQFEENEASAFLLSSPTIQRRNTGRVSDGLLKRYENLNGGGWLFQGVDLLRLANGEGLHKNPWGCFKPNNPAIDRQKQKPIKYEHPKGAETSVFAPFAPELDWLEMIHNSSIQRHATEGAKKACKLVGHGFAGFGLAGANGAVRKDENGNPRLTEAVKILAKPGSEFFIALDQDAKQSTRQAVDYERWKLGKLLKAEGCKVRIVSWNPEMGKGVDDLIVNHGVEAYKDACHKALPFDIWEAEYLHRRFANDGELGGLSVAPSVVVNQRYLEPVPLPDSKLIWVKSEKGTGKTVLMSHFANEIKKRGIPILGIIHRIQLESDLSAILGIGNLHQMLEIRDKQASIEAWQQSQAQGYTMTADSLHEMSQAAFKAERHRDFFIFIDEVEQVLWHILNSATCKKNRVAILKTLQQVIRQALSPETKGGLIVADADLSDVALSFIRGCAKGLDFSTWGLLNAWKPGDSEAYDVSLFEDSNLLVSNMFEDLRRGGKVFSPNGSRREGTANSATSLCRLAEKEFPDKRFIVITRDTIADLSHPASGLKQQNINDFILKGQYDGVFCTSTLGTGNSVDLKGYFTGVYGFFHGTGSPKDVAQQLGRVRENVPRYIWAKQIGFRIAGGETSVSQLLTTQEREARATISIIHQGSDVDEYLGLTEHQNALKAWAKKACYVNACAKDYRRAIISQLANDGQKIREVSSSFEAVTNLAQVSEDLKENRDQLVLEVATAKAEAVEITDGYAKVLEEKRGLTREERNQLEKHKARKKYGEQIEVSPDLFIKDSKGWHPALQIHYYLTIGREYLKGRDTAKLKEITSEAGGVWMPDINKKCLSTRITALDALGFTKLFESKIEWRSDDEELIAFADRCKAVKKDIRTLLGVTIKDDYTPVKIAGFFLNKMGLKLKKVRQERGGAVRIRVYKVEELDDGRFDVFGEWLSRDLAKLKDGHSVSD